jgi:heterodisulfide reductase subunit A-like polyferredoxin
MARNGEFPPERDVTAQAPKTGVFVCSCGDAISQIVDTDALTNYAESLPGVVHAEQVAYLCQPEGEARLRRTVEQGGINRVVVAACSHRTHESLFQRVVREGGLNPYLLDLTNIREHCAWAHRHDPAGATRKAKELVRMAAARARTLAPAYKEWLTPARSALVIGGGVSGMTSALAIADSGFEVVLVERSMSMGGNLNNVHFTAEGGNPQRLMRDLINRVIGHDRIRVLTNSEVIEYQGHVGAFRSVIETRVKGSAAPVRTTIEHGATIVATGGQEHRGDEYGLGKDARVVTQHQLEEMVVHSPERIAAMKQIVIVQCVRIPGAPDYCSRVCCTNTMKNATRIKMLNPNCEVIVLFKDIITYGFREQYYTEARRRGVLFVRYDDANKPVVTFQEQDGEQSGSPRTLEVSAHEPVLKEELKLHPDLLVISTPVVPSAGTKELAERLHVPLSSEGFYLEAHLKMRPMDFMEEGIFVAGMAHYPKFIEECISHALAAAGRVITILSQKPLYIGGVVAQVDATKCVGCLTCVRVCPFGIPQIRSDQIGNGGIRGAAWIDPAKCQGCGTCTGECPATAIQLTNYRDEQMMLRDGAGLGAWLPQSMPA